MAPSTSRKLTERGDLVLRALAPVGVTRAAFVAWNAANNSTLAVGTVVDCDGLSYRYTGAGTAIDDLPGWVPDLFIFTEHFGDAAEYDQASPVIDDALAQIHASFAYAASERSPGVAGGVVVTRGRYYTSGPVVVPVGVKWEPLVPVSSTGDGQTAGSTYPITYNEGSGIVGGHLVGPAILCGADDIVIGPLTIGATSARRAATISTGGQNRNCGILVETADTVSANIRRITLNGPLIKDQPAEGYVVCGDVTNFKDNGTHVLNVGSHGFAIDNGSLVGRTNKARPGIFTVTQWRGNNIGGHLWAIGHPSSGSDVPYRGDVHNCEGFRSGNVPALRYEDAGTYVYGEQVTFNNCAPSGTTGYSGSTVGATYAAFTAGRGVHYNNCRFINAGKAMLVGSETGVGTTDVKINGGHFSTTATSPDYAIDVTAVARGLFVTGMTGDYNIAPLDAAAARAFNPDGYGEIIYNDPVSLAGQRAEWNMPSNLSDVSITGFLNFGPRVLKSIVSGEITPTATRTSLATEGGAGTDDLRVINGGTDGDLLILSTSSASQDVVLKNRVSGTDNMLLQGAADVTLSHSSDTVTLIYRGTDARWLQLTPLADIGS
jgi:hypothetical protein